MGRLNKVKKESNHIIFFIKGLIYIILGLVGGVLLINQFFGI